MQNSLKNWFDLLDFASRKQSGPQPIVVDVTTSNWLDVSRHRWYRQNYSIHRDIDLRGRIHGSLKTTVV